MKMRTKSILSRFARESMSIGPDSTLASPQDDEANGNFCSGVISTTHCDTDVESVPDTVDERIVPPKKRHCLGTSDTYREGSVEPLLNLDACIVCEVADEWVTRCSGVDCLLSFHGDCLSTELGSSSSGSEDLANLYCPYCWLKILTLKSKTLKEKTIAAEKAVLKYLDKEKDNCSAKVQVEKDLYVYRVDNVFSMEETSQPEEDQGKVEVGTDKLLDGVQASENFRDAEDDKTDETAKDQTRVRTGAGKKGGVSPFLPMKESFEKLKLMELNTIDSETSKGSSSKRNGEDVTEQETSEHNGEDVTEQVTSSAQVTSPSGKMKSKTVRDISFFKKDQRRRLLWTYEEEEMLKVGVEKFAAEAKKNMPWRKILEMGEKVFHETRTPADLKDKWRTMIGARLGPKTNKTTAH